MASLVTTFYKTKSIVDLKLNAFSLNGAAFPAADRPLNANFKFTIVGVPKDEEQSKEFKQDWIKVA